MTHTQVAGLTSHVVAAATSWTSLGSTNTAVISLVPYSNPDYVEETDPMLQAHYSTRSELAAIGISWWLES